MSHLIMIYAVYKFCYFVTDAQSVNHCQRAANAFVKVVVNNLCFLTHSYVDLLDSIYFITTLKAF